MRNLTLKTLVVLAVLTWAGSAGAVPIEEFVQRVYIHSVPYAEASKYDASEVPSLLKMLQSPGEQEHWSNIVATLGIIGDERAVEPVIAFIYREKQTRQAGSGPT